MKADQAMGLVSAGSVSRSFLARIPALQAQLGPVKASSFQAAKQAVKTLRAGFAVSHYSALELSKLIWIAVPESQVDRVVRDLAAQMPVHQTIIVLCDCIRESSWANPLAKAGARIASLNAVDGSRETVFVGEGHPDAMRAVKRLLSASRRKLWPLEPRAKPLYFAGIHAATHLLLPWVDASVSSLRAAGLSRSAAMKVTDTLVRGVLRNYENSGAKAWDDEAPTHLRRSLERNVELFGAKHPRLAALYSQGIRMALAHFEPKHSIAGV